MGDHDELRRWARDNICCGVPLAVKARALEAIDEIDRLRTQRDSARAVARVLAHAYEHDNRPPAGMVAEALAYPVIPEEP